MTSIDRKRIRGVLALIAAGAVATGASRAQSSADVQILQGINNLRISATAQQTALTNLQNAAGTQNAALGTLQNSVNALQASQQSGFTGLQNALQAASTAQQTALTNAVNGLQTRLVAIQSTQSSQGTVLSSLQTTLSALQGAVASLQTAVSHLETRKKFYLTRQGSDGAHASAACAPGFHMASLSEIFNPSDLHYDTGLGYVREDSGSGLPFQQGWVRTGGRSDAGTTPGVANCSVWSSNDGGDRGTTAVWFDEWNNDPYSLIDPWRAFANTCNNAVPVWCKED